MLGALEEPEDPLEEPDEPDEPLLEGALDVDPPAPEADDPVPLLCSDGCFELPLVALPELPVPELPWPCLLLFPGHPSMPATATAPTHAIHLPRIERICSLPE